MSNYWYQYDFDNLSSGSEIDHMMAEDIRKVCFTIYNDDAHPIYARDFIMVTDVKKENGRVYWNPKNKTGVRIQGNGDDVPDEHWKEHRYNSKHFFDRMLPFGTCQNIVETEELDKLPYPSVRPYFEEVLGPPDHPPHDSYQNGMDWFYPGSEIWGKEPSTPYKAVSTNNGGWEGRISGSFGGPLTVYYGEKWEYPIDGIDLVNQQVSIADTTWEDKYGWFRKHTPFKIVGSQFADGFYRVNDYTTTGGTVIDIKSDELDKIKSYPAWIAGVTYLTNPGIWPYEEWVYDDQLRLFYKCIKDHYASETTKYPNEEFWSGGQAADPQQLVNEAGDPAKIVHNFRGDLYTLTKPLQFGSSNYNNGAPPERENHPLAHAVLDRPNPFLFDEGNQDLPYLITEDEETGLPLMDLPLWNRPPAGGKQSWDTNEDDAWGYGHWIRTVNPHLYHHFDRNSHRKMVWATYQYANCANPLEDNPDYEFVWNCFMVDSSAMFPISLDPREHRRPLTYVDTGRTHWYKDHYSLEAKQITDIDKLGPQDAIASYHWYDVSIGYRSYVSTEQQYYPWAYRGLIGGTDGGTGRKIKVGLSNMPTIFSGYDIDDPSSPSCFKDLYGDEIMTAIQNNIYTSARTNDHNYGSYQSYVQYFTSLPQWEFIINPDWKEIYNKQNPLFQWGKGDSGTWYYGEETCDSEGCDFDSYRESQAHNIQKGSLETWGHNSSSFELGLSLLYDSANQTEYIEGEWGFDWWLDTETPWAPEAILKAREEFRASYHENPCINVVNIECDPHSNLWHQFNPDINDPTDAMAFVTFPDGGSVRYWPNTYNKDVDDDTAGYGDARFSTGDQAMEGFLADVMPITSATWRKIYRYTLGRKPYMWPGEKSGERPFTDVYPGWYNVSTYVVEIEVGEGTIYPDVSGPGQYYWYNDTYNDYSFYPEHNSRWFRFAGDPEEEIYEIITLDTAIFNADDVDGKPILPVKPPEGDFDSAGGYGRALMWRHQDQHDFSSAGENPNTDPLWEGHWRMFKDMQELFDLFKFKNVAPSSVNRFNFTSDNLRPDPRYNSITIGSPSSWDLTMYDRLFGVDTYQSDVYIIEMEDKFRPRKHDLETAMSFAYDTHKDLWLPSGTDYLREQGNPIYNKASETDIIYVKEQPAIEDVETWLAEDKQPFGTYPTTDLFYAVYIHHWGRTYPAQSNAIDSCAPNCGPAGTTAERVIVRGDDGLVYQEPRHDEPGYSVIGCGMAKMAYELELNEGQYDPASEDDASDNSNTGLINAISITTLVRIHNIATPSYVEMDTDTRLHTDFEVRGPAGLKELFKPRHMVPHNGEPATEKNYRYVNVTTPIAPENIDSKKYVIEIYNPQDIIPNMQSGFGTQQPTNWRGSNGTISPQPGSESDNFALSIEADVSMDTEVVSIEFDRDILYANTWWRDNTRSWWLAKDPTGDISPPRPNPRWHVQPRLSILSNYKQMWQPVIKTEYGGVDEGDIITLGDVLVNWHPETAQIRLTQKSMYDSLGILVQPSFTGVYTVDTWVYDAEDQTIKVWLDDDTPHLYNNVENDPLLEEFYGIPFKHPGSTPKGVGLIDFKLGDTDTLWGIYGESTLCEDMSLIHGVDYKFQHMGTEDWLENDLYSQEGSSRILNAAIGGTYLATLYLIYSGSNYDNPTSYLLSAVDTSSNQNETDSVQSDTIFLDSNLLNYYSEEHNVIRSEWVDSEAEEEANYFFPPYYISPLLTKCEIEDYEGYSYLDLYVSPFYHVDGPDVMYILHNVDSPENVIFTFGNAASASTWYYENGFSWLVDSWFLFNDEAAHNPLYVDFGNKLETYDNDKKLYLEVTNGSLASLFEIEVDHIPLPE